MGSPTQARRTFVILVLGVLWTLPPSPAGADFAPGGKGVVIEDFESGGVTLGGYPDQNQQPDDWEVTGANVYEGAYALRIYGNCWKTQEINPCTIDAETVWQVAVHVEDRGEMSAFGVSDGANELFYVVAGTELPAPAKWWTVYQGSYPLYEWHAYHLPIGEDWYATYGYYPVISNLIYVNDDDAAQAVVTLFDAILDITGDLPVAPVVTAGYSIIEIQKIKSDLYRADIQFYGDVVDPDSDSHDFLWDFGDSSFSIEQNPRHEFLVHADYTYAVGFHAVDPDGMVGVDTCHVSVESGPGELPITVNFVGDVMTARTYENPGGIIETYGVEYIFTPTLPILGQAADVSVANLECTYTDQGTPHPTKFYTFRSRPENIAGAAYAGIDIVTLANNHILDYGLEGMLQTESVLDAAGILHSGCGMNNTCALLPTFWTERGLRIAFLGQCNFTEREWNHQPFPDAGANKPGFAYLIPKNLEKAITATRSQADVVILQLHSGIEYEPEPPPGKPGDGRPAVEAAELGTANPVSRFKNEPTLSERELRRLALDLGADIVINHHPHVLQGFESHGGKLIAHSLGNFIMDLSYVETLPTMVLTLEIDAGGISGYYIVPAWIDDYITQPATGRLGREILDRMADYSRPMGALVAVDPTAMTARVYPDPAAAAPEQNRYGISASMRVEDGYAISEPVELVGPGTLSRIISVTGDGLGAYEICWGCEILWHGDFEAEGATLWDTNTSDEWLDDTEAYSGQRSLALRRDEYDTQDVGTDLEKHLPSDPGKRHSFTGYMKGNNAAGANILGRFYSSRYGGTVLGDTEIGPELHGTSDWYGQWQNMDTPANGYYFEVRCTLSPPTSGEGRAWFDNLRFIEWETWQSGAPGLQIDHPNNYRFVQIRTPDTGVTTIDVTYEETSYSTLTATVPDRPREEARGCLRQNYPNPFNPTTTIVLDAPAGDGMVRASLTLYDVRGRKVVTLFAGALPCGSQREFVWDGTDSKGAAVASGVYFCRFTWNDRSETRRMVLLK
ncbi:MAG: CapA family protein [Candidatus Eisenbacteria sp.]|nr:CapA family protein [Candidatus Eisenbacteria bacterium]